jgi:hypothetical protein
MRGTIVADRNTAEQQLECTVELERSLFPAVILERAATRRDVASLGLNSLLRYYFVTAAQPVARSVIGVVFDGAPRLRVLTEIGYNIAPVHKCWDGNVADYHRVLLATLSRSRFVAAHLALRERVGNLLARFPYRGKPLLTSKTPATTSEGADADV